MASWFCPQCPYMNGGAICTKCGFVASIDALPKSVLLRGTAYNLRSAEDAILFSAEQGVAGCFTRLTFTRNCGCWHVSIIDSSDRAMVAHIVDAMELIEAWFGGNNSMPRGEHRP